jgi:hypothetical protein
LCALCVSSVLSLSFTRRSHSR